jgi:hypothetical protein
VIDGKSIVALMEGRPGARTPHEAFFYRKKGVRSGKWKYMNGKLCDLEADIAEAKDVAPSNPQVVERLKKLMADRQRELSKNSRPPGGTAKPRKKRRK